ncbi:hypothetical protein FUAX_46920 (plasmid) [Fulvitalea axinellae]|uniref:YtkA-like domain-containing protein n=1 Tax=Fulvitalea axinellae TaxID=1182444 RepID=A0AAU9CSI8_9BACT|nr:hypothetical protein FUAX_46920 [Fulvitalea axinellae]
MNRLTNSQTAIKIFVLAFVSLLWSCSSDNEDPAPESPYKLIHSIVFPNKAVAFIHATEDYRTGYNKLVIELKDSGNKAYTEADGIMLSPVMTMNSGMKHGCPVYQPTSTTKTGTFEGAIVFQMPGMPDMGSWEMKVSLMKNGAVLRENTTPISVKNKMMDYKNQQEGKAVIVRRIDGKNYVFGYHLTNDEAKVGNNPLLITAHRMDGHFDFTPLTDLDVNISPFMPSMGHGAPEGTKPAHKGEGKYEGSVNFSMTGDWQIKLNVKENEDLLFDDEAFYLEFN